MKPTASRKKRGYYFAKLHLELAKKYKTSDRVISAVRVYKLTKGLDQQLSCVFLTENLQKGLWDQKPSKKQSAETLLKFLLHLPPESYTDITQVTKFDK